MIVQAALEVAGHAPKTPEDKPKIIGPVRPADMDVSEPVEEQEEEEYAPPEDVTLGDAPEEDEEAALEHAKKIVIPEIPAEMLQQIEEPQIVPETQADVPLQPGPLAGVPEMLAQATAGRVPLRIWYGNQADQNQETRK